MGFSGNLSWPKPNSQKISILSNSRTDVPLPQYCLPMLRRKNDTRQNSWNHTWAFTVAVARRPCLGVLRFHPGSMKAMGFRGAVRSKAIKITTIADESLGRQRERLLRQCFSRNRYRSFLRLRLSGKKGPWKNFDESDIYRPLSTKKWLMTKMKTGRCGWTQLTGPPGLPGRFSRNWSHPDSSILPLFFRHSLKSTRKHHNRVYHGCRPSTR